MKSENAMKLVLAPGAADASEGLVPVDDGCVPCSAKPDCITVSAGEAAIEYTCHSEQQPGDGFWAIAPGCGDISEGRVWMARKRQL